MLRHALSPALIGAILAASMPLAAQDPTRWPARYAARAEASRGLDEEETAEAVLAGLHWLASRQGEDGGWRPGPDVTATDPDIVDIDVGITALATLAFLGEGRSLLGGTDAGVVDRAVRWLVQQQAPNGRIGRDSLKHIYSHSLALTALVEAYELADQPEWLADPIRRGLEHSLEHGTPYTGWGYIKHTQHPTVPVTSTVLESLAAAFDAGFLSDGAWPTTWSSVQTFLAGALDASTGRVGYTKRGEPASRFAGDHAVRFPREYTEGVTAAALHARELFDAPYRPAGQVALLLRRLPTDKPSARDYFYWRHATAGLALRGGKEWETWWDAVQEVLCEVQETEGEDGGSWDAESVWGAQTGRTYSTAMAVLTLQSPYRIVRVDERVPLPRVPMFERAAENWLERDFAAVDRLLTKLEEDPPEGADEDHIEELVREARATFQAEHDRVLDAVRRHIAAATGAAGLELQRIERSWRGLEPAKQARSGLSELRRSSGFSKALREARRRERERR